MGDIEVSIKIEIKPTAKHPTPAGEVERVGEGHFRLVLSDQDPLDIDALVSLAINKVRNSASMFVEPLTHFMIGPGPFDGLGITTIVLRCRSQYMLDKRLAAGPGLTLEIIVTEPIDQNLGLIEPRGMHRSIA